MVAEACKGVLLVLKSVPYPPRVSGVGSYGNLKRKGGVHMSFLYSTYMGVYL